MFVFLCTLLLDDIINFNAINKIYQNIEILLVNNVSYIFTSNSKISNIIKKIVQTFLLITL